MTAGAAVVPLASPEVRSGLEGVVAFATTIAEPDREGGALRYRGVDVEDLVGAIPFVACVGWDLYELFAHVGGPRAQ